MLDIKNYICESQSDEITSDDAKRESLPDEERYCVVLSGGSIGEQERKKFRVGSKRVSIVRDNLTKEEAKESAKRSNKWLSPGEKQYYQLHYSAVLATKVKEL